MVAVNDSEWFTKMTVAQWWAGSFGGLSPVDPSSANGPVGATAPPLRCSIWPVVGTRLSSMSGTGRGTRPYPPGSCGSTVVLHNSITWIVWVCVFTVKQMVFFRGRLGPLQFGTSVLRRPSGPWIGASERDGKKGG